VELIGLHATVAPRRNQVQSAPTLEHYTFTPYFESNLASAPDHNLVDYADTCHTFVYNHLKKLFNGSEVQNGVKNIGLLKNLIADTKSSEIHPSRVQTTGSPENNATLRLLQNIYEVKHDENFSKNINNLLESAKSELQRDPVLGFFRTERGGLKSCLDIVLENCISDKQSKLKVMEYTGSLAQIYDTAVGQFQSQPGLQLDYTVTGPGVEESLDQELLARIGAESVSWDVNGTGSVPAKIAQVDLVIAAGVLHRCAKISDALASLQALLRDGGFLLVVEPTKNLLLSWSLFALTHDLSYISDLEHRSAPPFNSESMWTKELVAAGLQVVAQKSDGVCHTAFLCRRKPSTVGADKHSMSPPQVIDISETDLSWVEEVKTSMTTETVGGSDADQSVLWLRSDVLHSAHSGIVGMVNCLRREPSGHRIRLVFFDKYCMFIW